MTDLTDLIDETPGLPNDIAVWQEVVTAVERELGTDSLTYLEASDIDSDHHTDRVGQCLGTIARQDGTVAGLDISIWSGEKAPPRTYSVRRVEADQ